MHTSRKVKGTFQQEASEGTKMSEMSMSYNSSGHHALYGYNIIV